MIRINLWLFIHVIGKHTVAASGRAVQPSAQREPDAVKVSPVAFQIMGVSDGGR